MIQKTYKLLLLLGLLLTTVSSFAASEAEYKKVSKAWTLNADGSQEYRYTMELTLFTHTAMNSTYGESFIVYNPKYQALKIHAAYTKQKDGSIVKTPDNGFVEVLPKFAADAPAYNGLKEMVVVHTGLELGATIYLDYSVVTKPGYYPELDIHDILQETSPVKEYKVSITIPASKECTWEVVGSNARVFVETDDQGNKTGTWRMFNVPAASREHFMTENKDEVPHLNASTFASNKEALASIAKTFKASVAYESKTFGQYLTENAKTNEEKVKIIQNHVVKNMDYVAIPWQHTGYTVRDIDEVLRSAYGTLAEKTQLLNVMLNAAGIPSEVLVVYPANREADANGLSLIKTLVVKATVDGNDQYLSAVSTAPTHLSQRGYLDRVTKLDGTPITTLKAEPTVVSEKKEVTVSKDNAKNGFVVCTLPASYQGINSWRVSTLNSKRTNTFELPSMMQQTITYTISADGLQLQTSTEEQVVTNAFGKVVRTITPKGNKVEVVRRIELNKQQFTPNEYKELRRLINEWIDPNNRVLLFSL